MKKRILFMLAAVVSIVGMVCVSLAEVQQPDIEVSPSSWDYGIVDVGDYADKTYRVINNGDEDLEVTSTTLVGTNPDQFSIVSGGGPFSIHSSNFHDIVVRFAPTIGGLKSATLRIINNDPDESTVDVPLTGTGCDQPDIEVSPTVWDYGIVIPGSSADKTFQVSNTGCVILDVISMTIVGADAAEYAITSGAGAFSAPPGSSHDVNIRFAPTTGGLKSATLRIINNDPDESTVDVPLTGTGCDQPDIQVSPTVWDFGIVIPGSSADKTFQVSNTGCVILDVISMTIVGADAAHFAITSGAAPVSVPPGSSHSIDIRFTRQRAEAKGPHCG